MELDSYFATERNRITSGMTEYMAGADVDYGQFLVDRCARILDSFYEATKHVRDRDSFLNRVRRVVEDLNELVGESDDIIETQEREDICLLIAHVGSRQGLCGDDEDVTESWREW